MTNSVKLDEYCNVKRAKWLLDNIDDVQIRKFNDPTYEPKANIKKYCKDVLKSNNGYLKRIYTNNDGKGRRFLKHNQIGYQNMLREYRSILCCEDFYDIDIRNCQPTILEQYCKQNDISCPKLSHYNSNRDAILKLMSGHLEKEDVKLQFITMMYGGKFDYEINEIYKIKSFYDEVQIIIDKVAKLNPSWVEYAKSCKEKNINGSVCSYVCQEIEDKIVMYAKDFLTKSKYEISALCFDGLMVRKTHPITPTILTQLNNYCYSKTQYKVEFLIKPFEQVVQIDPTELNYNPECHPIDNDKEASDILINLLNKKFIKSNGRIFHKKYDDANIYIEKSDKESKDILIKFIMNHNFQINQSNGMRKDYSRTIKGANNLYQTVIANLEDDEEFLKKVWKSNLYKLCFIDGYYDYKSASFKKYDEETYTTTYVKRLFPRDINESKIKELYEKILYPIFNDTPQLEFILNWFSRGLAGHYEEKTWAVGIGLRNSGKSVITKLFQNTFNNYVDDFTANELCCTRVGTGDIAKKLGWVIPFEFCRLNFSNELTTVDDSGKSLKLDGNLIKSISSGGDTKKARLNYKDQVSFKIQGRMLLFMNQMVEVEPRDSMETLELFEFPNYFKKELLEDDIEDNLKGGTFKIFKGDNLINETIEDDEICNALIHVMLNNYSNIKKNQPQTMIDNIDLYNEGSSLDDEATLKSLFKFTKNPNDRVILAEFNKIIKDNKINKLKCKIFLSKCNVLDLRSNGQRYKTGLKVIKVENIAE